MKQTRHLDFPMPSVERLGRPLWRAVELAIAWQIDVGRMRAGQRLPSTRTLARRLGLSRNTVATAFDALVADGYIAPRVGDGTYVLPLSDRVRPPLWKRPWQVVHDPDGLAVRVTN